MTISASASEPVAMTTTCLMIIRRVALPALLVALAVCPAPVAAQQLAVPPVRELGRRVGITEDSISARVLGIRPLSDGRLLVNDAGMRRVILLDSALRHPVVVVNPTPGQRNSYGDQICGLLPFYGDTSLFVDTHTLALLVLDPNGAVVRTLAAPSPTGIIPIAISGAFDGKGRFLYSWSGIVAVTMPAPGTTPPAPKPAAPTALTGIPAHDSIAIVRGDMRTHGVDTVGFVMRMISDVPHTERVNDTAVVLKWTMYPIRVTDEWAVVSDGSIAFVRASDYHIDWINSDGSKSASPKIPHEWTRLTDSAKQHLVDSTRRAADSATALSAAAAAKPMRPDANSLRTVYSVPDISAVPDYLPPFTQGAVKADAENNLWIREGAELPSITTPQVYDVVNRQGALIDRVRLPASLNVMGFGPGVVYLFSREGSGTVIVKYRIR